MAFVIEGQEFMKPGSKRKNDPQGRKYAQKGQNGQNQALEQGNQDNEDQSSENPPKRRKYKPESNVKHEGGQKIRSGPLTVKGILEKMAKMRAKTVGAEPCTTPEMQKPDRFHQNEGPNDQLQHGELTTASDWVKSKSTANLFDQRERAVNIQ